MASLRRSLGPLDNFEAPRADAKQALSAKKEISKELAGDMKCETPSRAASKIAALSEKKAEHASNRASAHPTPYSKGKPSEKALLIDGDYKVMGSCKSPGGDLSVGLFRPKSEGSLHMVSPQPKAEVGENMHIRFGSNGKAQIVKQKRLGCWVATSPAAFLKDETQVRELTVWHKCDDPPDVADEWTEEEWEQWDLEQWEKWENQWDGKWESEFYWSDDEENENEWQEVDTWDGTSQSQLNTPSSRVEVEVLGERGLLQSQRGNTPASKKAEGRGEAPYTGPFKQMLNDGRDPTYEGPFSHLFGADSEATPGAREAQTTEHNELDEEHSPAQEADGKSFSTEDLAKKKQGRTPMARSTPKAVLATTPNIYNSTRQAGPTPRARPTPMATPTPTADASTPLAGPTPMAKADASTTKAGPTPMAKPTPMPNVHASTPKAGPTPKAKPTPMMKADALTPKAEFLPKTTPTPTQAHKVSAAMISLKATPKANPTPTKKVNVETPSIGSISKVVTPPHPEPVEASPMMKIRSTANGDDEFGSARRPMLVPDCLGDEPMQPGDALIMGEVERASETPEPPSGLHIPVQDAAPEANRPNFDRITLEAFTVVQLREALQSRGESSRGKKAELVERLLSLEYDRTSPDTETTSHPKPDEAQILDQILREKAPKEAAVSQTDATASVDEKADEEGLDGNKLPTAELVKKMSLLKVVELRELLEAHGLQTSGKKAELVERLIDAGVHSPDSSKSSDDSIDAQPQPCESVKCTRTRRAT